MNFVLVGIALVLVGLCGFRVLRWILGARLPFSVFGLVPLSFGVGIGTLAILGHLTLLTGLHLPWAYAPFLALSLGGVWALRGARPTPSGALKVTGWGWFFLAAILFGVVLIVVLSVAFPLHHYDARALWGTKAKMLFYSGTLSSPDFTDPLRAHPHVRYTHCSFPWRRRLCSGSWARQTTGRSCL
ncbi:MAG: hypothetical protein AB1486_12725 [Planctomycetota bacterium]